MKIGLISDIHGNLQALNAVLDALQAQKVTLILCAGDLVCYGPNPNRVISQLRVHGIPTVAGNYDDAVAWNRPTASRTPSSALTEPIKLSALEWAKRHVNGHHRLYLRSLPVSMSFRFDGISLYLLHAGIEHLDEWYAPEQPEKFIPLAERVRRDVIVFGHSHQPYTHECERLDGKRTLFVNPGAVGRSLDWDNRASYAILDTQSLAVELHRIPYDIDVTINAIYNSGMPVEVASLIRHGVRRVEQIPGYEAT